MLFNRKFQLSLVKDDKKTPNDLEPVKDPIDYIAIATDLGTKILIGTCIVIVTHAFAQAAGQIAVNTFTSNDE